MYNFTDKVAIVTGGATGIGGATARRLAADGARVLIADINMDLAEANRRQVVEAGGEAAILRVDVSQRSDLEAMVNAAVERWGRLDMLVNNAWGRKEPDGNAIDLSETSWDWVMDVLVKALFRASKFALPHMIRQGGGSIVNLASVHGLLAASDMMAYDTAKTAVIGLTRNLAVDFGPQGVRVNAICPGLIITNLTGPRWEANPDLQRLSNNQYPLRRAGRPEDIANAIAFLCSDQASFVTGHALPVDGGLSVQLQDSLGYRQARFLRENPDVSI